MKTYVVIFNKGHRMCKRSVKARSRNEAIARVSHSVPGSFYHYIKEVK
jgi:hypothetical protein